MDALESVPAYPTATGAALEIRETSLVKAQDGSIAESEAAARPEFDTSKTICQKLPELLWNAEPDATMEGQTQVTPVEEARPTMQAQEQPLVASEVPRAQTTTPVLKTYRTLQPTETVDLVNTIQTIFETDSTVKENGVILLNAPHLVPAPGAIELPPSTYEFESTSQRITMPAKLRGTGLGAINVAEAMLTNRYPMFSDPNELSYEEMEEIFQKELTDKNIRHPYFHIDISAHPCRPEGSFQLTCGSPMNKLSYIAGVNSPYGYYSRGVSHFGSHLEDWHFASYNVVFAGATKLWVTVKPSSQQVFESKIRELFPTAGSCTQFVRHLAVNVTPSTLRKLGVEHFFVPQNPGQVVAVSGFTYHWGLNTGHNYAEAINFCMERDWIAPDNFKICHYGCGISRKSLPLLEPVYEDGDLKNKMKCATLRDVPRRKEWEQGYDQWEKQQQQKEKCRKPKPKPRMQCKSKTREQSEAIRLKPPQTGLHSRPRNDPAVVLPSLPRTSSANWPRNSSNQGSALLDSIEVAANARHLSGRDPRPRKAIRQPTYQIASSSPSEAETTDDEPPVKQTRAPLKPTHLRYN
jgi:hypothetical protein